MHVRNNKYAKKLARRICARMEELELSKSDLAKRSGLSCTHITGYCSGSHIPKADAVVKLAHGLNMSTDDLINFQV